MRIQLLGCNGQVGQALQRSLSPLGSIVAMDREQCDLANHEQLRRQLENASADVIVNAAAYTAVDKAENDAELAHAINGQALAVIGDFARQSGSLVVHYSTDYVYDGSKTSAWLESDPTGPLGVYGASKLAGDTALQGSGCACLIFRTSWVFAATGSNFPKTILRLAVERDSLNIVSDQIGAPTAADLIADTTALCLHQWSTAGEGRSALLGIYHLAASGTASWYDYARYVIEGARARGMVVRVAPEAIRPVPTSAYPTVASRPANSRLSVEKLERVFALSMPPWQLHVDRVLNELLGKSA